MKSVCVRTNDMTGNILVGSDDLTWTIRMPVVVSGDLSGAEIRCRIIIGGVTFIDGTTSISLWAKDFDQFGTGSLLFLKVDGAHANCRKFSIWKNGINLANFN